MAKLDIEVGGNLRSVAAEVAATWKAALSGHVAPPSDKIIFRDWDALCAVLTTQRYALLRTLHTMPRTSIAMLSAKLGLSEDQVTADVEAMIAIGFITQEPSGEISTAVDEIASTIKLAA